MSIYPYKTASESAKALAAKLGKKRIKREGSAFKGGPNKLVINWGSRTVSPEVEKCMVLNKPAAVVAASDKLKFFEMAKGLVNIPDYTTSKAVAEAWLEEGNTVLLRTSLSGHSGEGIHVVESMGEWEQAPHHKAKIYVKYIPKKEEYRVHVVASEVIDVRRKAVKPGWDGPNWKVRNLAGGFIYAKGGFETPAKVLVEAIKGMMATDLDFGAVDVIWNGLRDTAYVLEINTAPGLEGSTVDNYAAAFEQFYEKPQGKMEWKMAKGAQIKKGEVFLDEYLKAALQAGPAMGIFDEPGVVGWNENF